MNVYSIIVAFNPDRGSLRQLCATLLQSNSGVIVVDNSEEVALDPDDLPQKCVLQVLGSNSGIAHAQNVGIATALSAGADVIFFFDQDSSIDKLFVPAMLAGLDNSVAAVYAPVSVDAVLGFEYPSSRLNKWGLPRPVYSAGHAGDYAVDMVISSGSLVTVSALAKVGVMDEDFFIDYVDLEWCLRCRALGVEIFVRRDVQMKHSIGQRSIKVGPITTFVHSPARTYYKMRNPFLLLGKDNIRLSYAAKEIMGAFLHHFVQLAMLTNRKQYVGPVLAGLWDGLRRSGGKRVE